MGVEGCGQKEKKTKRESEVGVVVLCCMCLKLETFKLVMLCKFVL